MNYTNREVIRRLKQYDMFLESLNLTTDSFQRERICDQLDKIEKQILLDTNSEYEEEYLSLSTKESNLLEEEKTKLKNLIALIEDRRNYLNKRKEKHKEVTGSLVELTTFLGEDKLSFYQKKLKTIEKYETNKIAKEKLISEMKTLDIKISESSRNVKANMRLNDMLETKMITLVGKSLEKLNLYSLMDKKEEIQNQYSSLSYAKEMALDNLNSIIKLNKEEMKPECEEMLSEITKEYNIYDEQINIIKLIEIYDKPTSGYDSLLEKREEIDNILRNITSTPLYKLINDELSKGYNTIKLEKQDIKLYDELREEREKKNKRLYEIDEENNSKEFKELLEDLIKKENKYKEEKIRLARNKESKEREKKQIESQKIEASRVKRQKLIEEAKLKEQTSTYEKLKELQNKTVISREKEKILEKKETKQPEKINNPEETKSFEDILKYEDKFDTNELFGNTKILPNKPSNLLEDSLFKEVSNETPLWTPPKEEKVKEDTPLWTPTAESEVAFKEDNPSSINIEINNEKKEEFFPSSNKQEEKKSIYDILENNQNIIWKSTENKDILKEVPIIQNKNKKEDKEGEVLWKETI